MDDQTVEFLLNNFARLTNIISEECPTFALSKSVFRLQLLCIVSRYKLLKTSSQATVQYLLRTENREDTGVLLPS